MPHRAHPAETGRPILQRPKLRTYLPGPGLWTTYFLIVWLNATLLAMLVHLPEPGWLGRAALPAWTVGLGLMALFAAAGHLMLQDTFSDMTPRTRAGLVVIATVLFFCPSFANLPVVPHGFLWTLPFFLLTAVREGPARRYMVWSFAGAWMASLRLRTHPEMAALGAYAFSWLLLLGTIHVTFRGAPYGLRGWWPLWRIVRNSLVTVLPAALVGGAMWLIWPTARPEPVGIQPPGNGLAPREPERLAESVDSEDVIELIRHATLVLVITIVLFIGLVYMRRFLLNRRRGGPVDSILPGQVARVREKPVADPPRRFRLPGLRGQIMEVWKRWAEAMEREGWGRAVGETAEGHRQRLEQHRAEAAPPAEMVHLLEQVHYSERQPNRQDLQRMRRFVRAELQRQGKRLRRRREEPEG